MIPSFFGCFFWINKLQPFGFLPISPSIRPSLLDAPSLSVHLDTFENVSKAKS